MHIEKRAFDHSFETEKHLSDEQMIVDEIHATSNILARKLPKRDVLDFVLTTDDEVIGFLEVRGRRCPWSIIENGGFFLPLKKWMRIKEIYNSTGIKTCLVVVAKDETKKLWIGKHNGLSVKWWGDTRDDKSHDREPMVVIPTFFFEDFQKR